MISFITQIGDNDGFLKIAFQETINDNMIVYSGSGYVIREIEAEYDEDNPDFTFRFSRKAESWDQTFDMDILTQNEDFETVREELSQIIVDGIHGYQNYEQLKIYSLQ